MANENKNDKILLSEEGLEKLNAELRELIDVKRPEIIKAIQEAREQGDLSENADYDAARDHQARVEARIKELDYRLSNLEIIDESKPKGRKREVGNGSTVVLRFLDDDSEETYKIVGTVEADPLNGKISNESPVGRALIGARVGDVVEVLLGDETDHYKILEITRNV
jgi:transcription elongation factor GreA